MAITILPIFLLFGLILLGGIVGLVLLLVHPKTRVVTGVLLLSIGGLFALLFVPAALFWGVQSDSVVEMREMEMRREHSLRDAYVVAPEGPPPLAAELDSDSAPGEAPAWVEGRSTWTLEDAYWARVRVGPYPRDEAEPSINQPLPRAVAPDELRQMIARDLLLREMFQEAVNRAVAQYTLYLEPEHSARLELPVDFVLGQLVAETWQSAAAGPDAIPLEPVSEYADMVNLHVLLKFDAAARRHISALWRDAVVQARTGTIARGLIGLVALMAVILGYLRIDLATRGRYRGRLRCAAAFAILVVVAAALVAVWKV